MVQILAALAPILAKILFLYFEKKQTDKENKRKFLEAVQSVDALKSKNMKKQFDELIAEMEEERKKEEKEDPNPEK